MDVHACKIKSVVSIRIKLINKYLLDKSKPESLPNLFLDDSHKANFRQPCTRQQQRYHTIRTDGINVNQKCSSKIHSILGRLLVSAQIMQLCTITLPNYT